MKTTLLKILILALPIATCKDKNENKKDNDRNTAIAEKSKSTKKSFKNIQLIAKPDPITINVSKTAVIVVDMLNDFAAKGGMYDRAGFNISKIQEIVDPIAKLLTEARNAGVKIIYLKMGYQPDLSDLGSEEYAMLRDYLPVVLEDCTAGPIGNDAARSNKEDALLRIQTLFGWVTSSQEFIKALNETP